MTDNEQILSLEEAKQRKDSLEAKRREEDALLEKSFKAHGATVFNSLMSQLNEFGDYFTASQKKSITEFFGGSAAPAAEKSTAEKTRKSSTPKYSFGGGEHHAPRGFIAKEFVAWYESEEGKAYFAALKKSRPKFDLALKETTNSDGKNVKVPTRGYPLNSAYVDAKGKAADVLEPDVKPQAAAKK